MREIFIVLALMLVGCLDAAPSPRFAVLVPMHDISTIRSWQAWNTHTPCNSTILEEDATLVVQYAYNGLSSSIFIKEEVLLAEIKRAWDNLDEAVQRCFRGGIQFVAVSAPESHIAGANAMWLDAFPALRDLGFDIFLLMEFDLLPIQDGWLSAVMEEATAPAPFWVRGSREHICGLPHNPLNERYTHFNGNAIYSLAPDFDIMRTLLKDRLLNISSTPSPYDMYLAETIQDLARHSPELLSFYVPSSVILACTHMAYEASSLATNGVFLVHSNIPLASVPEQAIWETCQTTESKTKGEPPKSLASLKTMIENGELQLPLSPSNCHLASSGPDNEDWNEQLKGKMYVYSMDHHGGPVSCQGPLWKTLGVVTHAEISDEHCSFHGVCQTRATWYQQPFWRTSFTEPAPAQVALAPCPQNRRRLFWEMYSTDPELNRVDAFFCGFAVANCELFMPFNRSLIVMAATRLELGRGDTKIPWAWANHVWPASVVASQTKEWFENLVRIAAKPGNAIVANNVYDAKLIEYMTGVVPHMIGSWCGPTTETAYSCLPTVAASIVQTYRPVRSDILFGASRDVFQHPVYCRKFQSCEDAWAHPLLQELRVAASESTFRFSRCKDLYKDGFSSDQLVQHPALLFLPYQSSIMTFFELYRQNIPIFVPSKELLLKWHAEYDILFERVYGLPLALPSGMGGPSPNSDALADVSHWMQFYDYYLYPHVIYFDSLPGLVKLIETTDFHAVSQLMKQHNIAELSAQTKAWKNFFSEVVQPGASWRAEDPNRRESLATQAYADVMMNLWDIDVEPKMQSELLELSPWITPDNLCEGPAPRIVNVAHRRDLNETGTKKKVKKVSKASAKSKDKKQTKKAPVQKKKGTRAAIAGGIAASTTLIAVWIYRKVKKPLKPSAVKKPIGATQSTTV